MKRKLLTIFASVMLLLVVVVAVAPQPAKAADILSSLACAFSPANCAIKLVAGDFIMSIFASIGNAILQISAWFLSMAGIILNISIILTMNIKAIYEATPAINDIWIVIRNLSSIFIIFVLLYASISTILDVGKTNIKELVGKIIMAGLLINFSLFFTKVAIDASNLISLQFYRAIVPTSATASITKDKISEILSASYTGGGISDVFMYNLKITKIYNKDSTQNGLLSETNGGSYFKIAVSTFAGFALMMIAALSIFAAAIAFIIRLVILLLLMGFSPIYFAGMIFPEVKSNISDKWLGWLKDQLIFMPVYLLLLYVALRFISTMNPAGKAEGFMLALDKAQSTAGANTSGSGILLSGVGILFQYTIALIMINIPLIAAAKTGGISTQWGTTASKWVSGKLKNGGGAAWRNTGGFVASKVADSDFAKKKASEFAPAAGALRGLRGIAKSYDEVSKKKGEERAKFGESLGYDKRSVNGRENSIALHKNDIDKLNLIISDPRIPKDDIRKTKAKADKKAIEAQIRKSEKEISDIKRGRQIDYAERLDPRTIDPDTGKLKAKSLWQYVRKGKGYISKNEQIGSSQIHIKNTKAEIEQLKKELDDKKKEQDTIKTDIKRLDDKERKEPLTDPEDKRRKELQEELHKLLEGVLYPGNDPDKDIKGINKLGQIIREKELEVKRYENLT